MQYQLKFLDSQEQVVREVNIDAEDDDAAMIYSCKQAVVFEMAIELCHEARTVIRTAPETARLYLRNRGKLL